MPGKCMIGATWTFVGAPGLTATRLVLPLSTAAGQFYAYGTSGLVMTVDGGRTFVNVTGPVGGYAVAAPAWTNLGVLLSNLALWRVQSAIALKLQATFPPAEQALGAPLFLRGGPAGVELLQPVADQFVPGQTQVNLLRCTPTCSSVTPLPFDAPSLQLIASPTESTDHTIFALSNSPTLAVSHDDGQSFTVVGRAPIMRMIAVASSRGTRLVATILQRSGLTSLMYSDDEGRTWQRAAIAPELKALDSAYTVTAVAPGRLVAPVDLVDPLGSVGFACSSDGTAWSPCTGDPG